MSTGTTGSVSASPRALLQVSLKHEYYGGAFEEFTATPLPTTATVCRQLNLRMLRDGASLTLFVGPISASAKGRSALRAALARSTLCWEIAPSATDFAAITGVSFSGDHQRIVLTDSTGLAVDGQLTVDALVSEKDVWSCQPLAFDYRPPSPLPMGTKLDIVAAATGTIVSQLAVADGGVIPIDVRTAGAGLYQLLRGNKLLTQWFADERSAVGAGAKPAAMLIIDGDLLVAAFDNLVEGSASLAPPVYSANFPTREITWRYHIFNARSPEALQIATADDGLTANEPTPRSAAGALGAPSSTKRQADAAPEPFISISAPEYPDAVSFEAATPYKLVQRPPQRFSLLSDGQALYSPLPVASTGFSPRGQSPGHCSDIFVYL